MSRSRLWLLTICAQRPDLVRLSLVNVVERIEQWKVQIASPFPEYSISDIETTPRSKQGAKNTGKIVLNLGPTEPVPVSVVFSVLSGTLSLTKRHQILLDYKPSYSLDPQATYISLEDIEVLVAVQLAGWQDEAQRA